ncbi:MAG: hypothetical protein ABFS45_17880 [Pseudomonadota bacterium]
MEAAVKPTWRYLRRPLAGATQTKKKRSTAYTPLQQTQRTLRTRKPIRHGYKYSRYERHYLFGHHHAEQLMQLGVKMDAIPFTA